MAILLMVILSILIFFTLGLDCIYQITLLISRKGMGKITNQRKWENLILEKNKKWSIHMPIVPSNDNFRYIILNIIKGEFFNNTIQSWQKAMIEYSLLEHYSNNKKKTKIDDIVDKYIDKKGLWKIKISEIDSALLAYVILKYYDDKQKIKQAMDEIYYLILKRKSSEDELICYRLSLPNLRFVDTIGLVCPFLLLYGQVYNNSEANKLAENLINSYLKNGFLHNEYLPFHAYDVKSKLPQGIIGWGRGLGWFLLGITEKYKILQNQITKNLMIELADNLLEFQQDDGRVGWIISQGHNYDSSITAIYAYFYSVCYKITLDNKYKKAAKKSLCALKKSTRRDGAIDYSQGDTKGLGVYSSSFNILPFTQGITLLAIETLKGVVGYDATI